jgi:hypothetical protein
MIGRGTRTLPGVIEGIGDPDGRRAAIAESDKPSLLALDFVGNAGKHKLIHVGDVLGGNFDDEVVARATEAARSASSRDERLDMLQALRDAERILKEEKRRQRARIVANTKVATKVINPFDVFDLAPKREPGWHVGRKPTEKQLAFLDRAGIPTKDLSFCKASQLISETIKRRDKKLCTFNQAKLLQRFGEPTDIGFEEASRRIDAIAKNHWKPLMEPVT